MCPACWKDEKKRLEKLDVPTRRLPWDKTLFIASLAFLATSYLLNKSDDRLVDSTLEKHLENYETIEQRLPESKEFIQETKNNSVWYSERLLKERSEQRRRLSLQFWISLSTLILSATSIVLRFDRKTREEQAMEAPTQTHP